jgi:predicted MFS family arabinose efflux permease
VSVSAIYSLGAQARSRLDGLYLALFFIGGAIGSTIASLTYALSGWDAITWSGFAFPIAALALFATEFATSGKGRMSRRGSASSGK